MSPNQPDVRLDAAESVFFKRQLEAIDTQVYDQVYPQYKARSFMTTVAGIPEASKVFTYRMLDRVSKAKVIGPEGDDLPSNDVFGAETSQIIHYLGNSYKWNIFELKLAAQTGTPLDAMKAMSARQGMEELIDSLLSLGDTTLGITGLLKIASGTTTFTPGTKTGGGLTWGTLAAPNATGAEVANDLMGIASRLVENTKGAFTRFKIALPIEQYNYAAQVRIGTVSDTTALKFALATSPYIESIEPWYRCDGAGSAGADRMIAWSPDPKVVQALVPMEFRALPAQERGINMVVNCTASCGGVVARYPVAIAYADGI